MNTITKKKKYNFSRNHSLMVFYTEDGKILFQDRTSISKDGEKYGFFGGGVDEGESFLDACIRETKEELNLDITKDCIAEAARFTKTVTGVGHCENVVFVALWKEKYEKNLKILEGDAGVWMTLEEASREIFFNHDYMVFNLLERYFDSYNEWYGEFLEETQEAINEIDGGEGISVPMKNGKIDHEAFEKELNR